MYILLNNSAGHSNIKVERKKVLTAINTLENKI